MSPVHTTMHLKSLQDIAKDTLQIIHKWSLWSINHPHPTPGLRTFESMPSIPTREHMLHKRKILLGRNRQLTKCIPRTNRKLVKGRRQTCHEKTLSYFAQNHFARREIFSII
mgnify:CR=1 FL=1